MFLLRIHSRPKPKQRPRVARGHAYTPKETVQYERLVVAEARSQGISLIEEGPVGIEAQFYVFGGAGDEDNLIKIVMDALNGVAWKDDRQIKHHAAWTYSCPKAEQRSIIRIGRLEEFPPAPVF